MTDKGFEGWAIVELMGHRRLAGYLSEATIAGAPFVRVDIPCAPPATQFYSGPSIYCITPTTEELARAVAARSSVAPVQRWELPAAPAPGPPRCDGDHSAPACRDPQCWQREAEPDKDEDERDDEPADVGF